ncbi:MAG: hypothetical protein LBF19_03750, partial [Prevotellaceae bacterium]|nr:hypothetical protein [Prevotellaceae bacterium]
LNLAPSRSSVDYFVYFTLFSFYPSNLRLFYAHCKYRMTCVSPFHLFTARSALHLFTARSAFHLFTARSALHLFTARSALHLFTARSALMSDARFF